MKKMLVIIAAIFILLILAFSCSYKIYKNTYTYSDEIISSKKEAEETTEEKNEEAAAAVKNSDNKETETEDTDEPDYNYLVGELNGYIAVYTSSGSLYEFTDIRVDLLEESLKERIKEGIKFKKAKEMFTFLESCSS